MSQLSAAVIGLGVGEQHIAGYQAHPDCRVVAICDIDPAKLAEVASRHPHIPATTEVDKVLSDPAIDVVSIASPDDAHHLQVVAALGAGKHVFVEKPLCLFPQELADIEGALSARPDLRLGCNLILRQSPRFAGLRDMIRRGDLGEVYQIDVAYNYGRLWKITEGWRGDIEDYSVTLGGGIHLLDLMIWMLGSPVVEVAAFGSNIVGAGSKARFDDAVTAILRFESGAIGSLSSNFGCVYPHFHQFEAYGTKATFENRPEAGLLFTSRDPAVAPSRIETAYPGVHKGGLIGNFIDSILGKATPIVSAGEVFDCMRAGLAIEKALRERTPIAL